MSTATVPGLAARTAVITTECRQNRTDQGAIDEAIKRIRQEMERTIPLWPLDKGATFFLCFTVDREGRKSL